VGIQVPRKGHDVLLRSLANIKHIPWQAVIVGPPLDAGYAASLVDLTQELGLADRVELAGLVSDAELAALYRSASIFALATRFEGYGMVFGEAMVHGLPIVSCRVGAVGETVPAKASMLVAPNDPDAFGSALAKLLQDPGLHADLSSAASEAGANLISWKESARLVGEMLDAISVGND
jgi:glycosyltransferase involved in cell wall biosynthesis